MQLPGRCSPFTLTTISYMCTFVALSSHTQQSQTWEWIPCTCFFIISLCYVPSNIETIHCFRCDRRLLLSTIPVLIGSLIILVVSSVVSMGSILNAVFSTISVVMYFCCFVMGFGPIPNILCSEIFPTSVRGVCIAICALTFWTGDIIVTYTLPIMLTSIGLAGVFAIYAVVCCISWVFVFLKVPETKGMPLEVITEFFAVGARSEAAEKN